MSATVSPRDNSVSNFRFICILLMTFAHNDFAASLHHFGSRLPYVAHLSTLSFIALVFVDGFSRISMPFLGCLSGYFVSMNLGESSYTSVIKRRFFSLYVPVVVWSTFFFVVMIAAGYATADHAYIHRKLMNLRFDDFLGLSAWPIDYPMHYLVSLFKCVLIAPILIFVLERFGVRIYLLVVVPLFLLLAGTGLRQGIVGVPDNSFWPKAEILLCFSLGILAHRSWKLSIDAALEHVRVKSKLLLLVVAIMFVLGTLHWRWLAHQPGDFMLWSGFVVLLVVRVTGSMLVLALLPMLRWFSRRGFYIDDRLTFNLFCTHVISFYLLQIAIGWGLASRYSTLVFFVAPLFAIALAAVAFQGERLIKQSLNFPARSRVTG